VGRVFGAGTLGGSESEQNFTFRVQERELGEERGHLTYQVRSQSQGPRAVNRFKSTRIDTIAFWDDSAVFSGVGTWYDSPGYAFEARALDRGEPGRGRDTLELTILDVKGLVVWRVEGVLASGNIQSSRPNVH